MYSRDSGYAIRPLVRLAKTASYSGKYLHLAQIVDRENRPPQYLAKILQRLSREGILQSRRGPSGGFAFLLPPDKVDLLKINRAMDGGIPCFERGALASVRNLLKRAPMRDARELERRARMHSAICRTDHS